LIFQKIILPSINSIEAFYKFPAPGRPAAVSAHNKTLHLTCVFVCCDDLPGPWSNLFVCNDSVRRRPAGPWQARCCFGPQEDSPVNLFVCVCVTTSRARIGQPFSLSVTVTVVIVHLERQWYRPAGPCSR
jgi:hypothetical protein